MTTTDDAKTGDARTDDPRTDSAGTDATLAARQLRHELRLRDQRTVRHYLQGYLPADGELMLAPLLRDWEFRIRVAADRSALRITGRLSGQPGWPDGGHKTIGTVIVMDPAFAWCRTRSGLVRLGTPKRETETKTETEVKTRTETTDGA